MIDWGRGYSTAYYVYTVDPYTWTDVDRIDITGGSISRDDTDLRQSADISTINYDSIGESWIRVYMIVKQGNDAERVPIFTGLATSPSKTINGRRIENTFQCYSVLKPAEDVLLRRGWYASKGMLYTDAIKQLVAPIFAPVTIEPSDKKLTKYFIAESNESHLSMLDSLLYAVNWRIRIDGDGSIFIGSYDYDEILTIDSRQNDVLETSIGIENDWYSCPNVLRVVTGDREYIEYDRGEASYSIPNRGREVWAEDTGGDYVSGENLEHYAKQKLAQLQKVATKVSYSRSYNPAVQVSDVIRLNYPEQNISGIFYVSSQSITIGRDARTSEEVVKIESSYR